MPTASDRPRGSNQDAAKSISTILRRTMALMKPTRWWVSPASSIPGESEITSIWTFESPSVIRPWTTGSHPASAIASMAGPTATSTSAPSSPGPRTSKPFTESARRRTTLRCDKVLSGWGPGSYDAVSSTSDGKAFRPDGRQAVTLDSRGVRPCRREPAARGPDSWGSVTYWNAFVANLEMHGRHLLRPGFDHSTSRLRRGQQLRGLAQPPRPGHPEAGRAALLSTGPPGAGTARRQLRHGGRRARRDPASNGRPKLRHLSRPPPLHRARMEPSHARGDRPRRLPGRSLP